MILVNVTTKKLDNDNFNNPNSGSNFTNTNNLNINLNNKNKYFNSSNYVNNTTSNNSKSPDFSNKKINRNKKAIFSEETETESQIREVKPGRDLNKSSNDGYINDIYRKFDFDYSTSPEEEEEKRRLKEKHENALERCMMLYERAKIKNEVDKLNFYKNIEVKENKELNNCSFKPFINERNNKQEENLKLIYKNTKIYNRSQQWKENIEHKIEKNRREIFREQDENLKPKV